MYLSNFARNIWVNLEKTCLNKNLIYNLELIVVIIIQGKLKSTNKSSKFDWTISTNQVNLNPFLVCYSNLYNLNSLIQTYSRKQRITIGNIPRTTTKGVTETVHTFERPGWVKPEMRGGPIEFDKVLKV